ncbi:hypothetical protein SynRS9907_00631 [Synechococcus sp. RS9907]|nr:hypothetical protein SynRS9907_00631 [Synechococcus sp. RS9907]
MFSLLSRRLCRRDFLWRRLDDKTRLIHGSVVDGGQGDS